jgi:hypothetical protein
VLGTVAPVVAVDVIVELGILAIAVALILLRKAWVSTFGTLLRALAAAFDKVSIKLPVIHYRIGFNWAGDLLRWIDHAALRLLGEGINATETAAKTLWHWTAYYAEQSARVLADFAESTWSELHHLRRWVIPAYVTQRLAALVARVDHLTARLEQIAAHPATIVRPVTRLIDPRVRDLEHELDVLRKQVAVIGSGVLAPPIPVPHLDTGPISRGIDALRDRIGRLTRQLSPAAVAGLVAAALVTLRLGWLKCSGVRRAAEHACGMDRDILEALLAGTVAVIGTVSLVEFAREMQVLTAEIEPAVRRFWQA